MTKEEATAKIAELVQQAHDALAAAEKVSEESGVPFYWNSSAGRYTPESFENPKDEYGEDDEEHDDYEYFEYKGWERSDSTC